MYSCVKISLCGNGKYYRGETDVGKTNVDSFYREINKWEDMQCVRVMVSSNLEGNVSIKLYIG